MQLAIDLPDKVLSALRLAPVDLIPEMRIAAAIQWYAERRVSQQRAAEIAGLSHLEFIDELRRRKVPAIQTDPGELDAETGNDLPSMEEEAMENEAFVGTWRDRSDMADSTAWVRNLRQKEWG
uniref:Predicted antitoxin, contains HTH domain n=1 Tax=Candidatus Kentrum sp. FW TaxID=2126338 RepID=A0A450TXY1_9GAMM|nr:MAG: Predicted antitoxin, contains HTH domain [Candidatus Kentron sp. FW]